ncbi:MAG: hypothetical protein ACRECY_07375 [Phyllobacterium sp.]
MSTETFVRKAGISHPSQTAKTDGTDGVMEAQLAKLSAEMENIKIGVADIKADIRELRSDTNTPIQRIAQQSKERRPRLAQ